MVTTIHKALFDLGNKATHTIVLERSTIDHLVYPSHSHRPSSDGDLIVSDKVLCKQRKEKKKVQWKKEKKKGEIKELH